MRWNAIPDSSVCVGGWLSSWQQSHTWPKPGPMGSIQDADRASRVQPPRELPLTPTGSVVTSGASAAPVVGTGKSLSRVRGVHHRDVDVEATMRGLHEPGAYRDLASNPGTNDAVLRALADCQYPFVWHALAANPRTPADVLTRLCMQRDSTWNDNRLLLLIARHPHADRDVLLAVLGRLKALLTIGESHPYAAVLALATRAEITPEDVQVLALLPGASARMRRGLRRRIAERREA